MKVISDLLDAMVVRKVTLLGLLDLIAAFDTDDHNIILKRLEVSFGIGGSMLEWFQSFLTNQTQAVSIQNVITESIPLRHGVPQG